MGRACTSLAVVRCGMGSSAMSPGPPCSGALATTVWLVPRSTPTA